jgi:hypothetical protein
VLGGECAACGAEGEAPCTAGCNAGLVSANLYKGSSTSNVCVAACGSIGQLPCTSGPMGYQNGQWQGGCTEWDAVIVSGSTCQWPTSCGHNGQGCCDAGNIGQTPNTTTDLCHDGSGCGWDWGWQCTGGGSSSGGTPCTVVDYYFYEDCGASGGEICQDMTPIATCAGYTGTPTADTGCGQVASCDSPDCCESETAQIRSRMNALKK